MARSSRANRASRRCRQRRSTECKWRIAASSKAAVSGVDSVAVAAELPSPRAVTFAPDVPEEEPRFMGRRPRAYTCYNLEELLGGSASELPTEVNDVAEPEKASSAPAQSSSAVADVFCQEPAPSELSTEEPASENDDAWEEPAFPRRPRFSDPSEDEAEQDLLFHRRRRCSPSSDDDVEQDVPVRRVRFCEPDSDEPKGDAGEEPELPLHRARPRAMTEYNLEDMVAGYEARRKVAMETDPDAYFGDL